MFFIIQDPDDCASLTIDAYLIKDLIDSQKNSLNHYQIIKNEDMLKNGELRPITDFPKAYRTAIPFGTLEFTSNFLKIFKDIDTINPIEIPKCLRTHEFLKRKYEILQYSEIPKNGRYFVKNVSKLKDWTYCGEIAELHKNNKFDEASLYQISEIVEPIAEYRVYVIGGKIYAIAYYDGDPCVFPDTHIINKANLIYSMQKDYPRSYTMDVMVTEKGTCITEIHVLFSCGIYQTVLGTDFLYGYQDAMKYTEKFNTPIIDTI